MFANEIMDSKNLKMKNQISFRKKATNSSVHFANVVSAPFYTTTFNSHFTDLLPVTSNVFTVYCISWFMSSDTTLGLLCLSLFCPLCRSPFICNKLVKCQFLIIVTNRKYFNATQILAPNTHEVDARKYKDVINFHF